MNLPRPVLHAIHVCYLLAKADERLSSDEIARRLKFPMPQTRKVCLALRRAGILNSKAGPGGGYFFSAEPEEVTLLMIAEVFGGVASKHTLKTMSIGGELEPAIRHIASIANKEISGRLSRATFRYLVRHLA